MYTEPDEESLDAPKDLTKLMKRSIYWNSNGYLVGADLFTIFQYISFIIFIWSFLTVILYLFIENILSAPMLYASTIIISIGSITISFVWFYNWGWNNYQEKWYYFDEKNQLFTAIFHSKEGWESIEIPYEEVDEIEYVHGTNGKAIIVSNRFEFETSRSRDKRASSVTELWPKLAKMGAKMTNWPIELECQTCGRKYGHHIGTALCPFCTNILIDNDVKGRIDPIEQHQDDMDRV